MTATPLWEASITEGLVTVDDCIKETVRTGSGLVDEVVSYLLSRGGKRLRPALTLLAAGGRRSEAAITSAAAVELIHVASLHHDDVIDCSDHRRGDLTVNARWGNNIAALAGTHLFACAGRLLAPIGDEAVQRAGKAADDLQTGMVLETENNYNQSLSAEDHLHILTLKTASLFQLALFLGSRLHPDAALRMPVLACYARHLGLAFQLFDDVMDFTGDLQKMGKDAGDDIDAGVYSLPVLMTLADPDCGPPLQKLLSREALLPREHAQIVRLLNRSGAVRQARRQAINHSNRAVAALAALPKEESTAALKRIARFATAREI